jgi:hypothetical protein
MKKPLFEYLNSPFSLLIAGFFLTTLVGSYINHAFHAESWKSKARFEIFKERLKEANEAQSSIIELSNKRITLLGRIHSELQGIRLQSARNIWKEYFELAKDWNNKVKSNNNRLSLLFGDSVSLSFLDNDENLEDKPKSLHHIIRKAHISVLDVIECMKSGCNLPEKEKLLLEAQNRLDLLGLAHDNFSTQLRIVLRQKETELLE